MRLAFTAIVAGMIALAHDGPALALNPARSITQYKHTRWSIDDGAPRGVIALAQGASGYLWIGSSSGLTRFDGLRFEAITPADGSEPRGVSAVAVLANGDVWVGHDAGVSLFRGGQLRSVAMPDPDYVMDIVQTSDLSLWATLGREDHQLMRFQNGRWTEAGSAMGLPAEQPVKMIATRDGALWVATLQSVMVLPSGAARFQRVDVRLNGHGSLCEDREGRVWLSDGSGSRVIGAPAGDSSRGGHLAYATPTARRKVQTFFDRDGSLWGLAEKGIFRARGMKQRGPESKAEATSSVDLYGLTGGLLSDRADTLFEDREGNIWIGGALGLERFRAARVVVEPLLNKRAFWGDVLLGARDGSVYVGEADAVYRVPAGGSPQVLLRGDDPQALCEAPDGAVWIVLQDKVARTFRGRTSFIRAPPGTARKVSDCAVDARGRVWIAATQQGLFEQVDGGWRQTLAPSPDRRLSPKTLLTMRDRQLLVGYEEKSVALFSPPNTTRMLLGGDSGLGRIRTLHEAADRIFVGAQAGLGELRGSALRVLSSKTYPEFRAVAGVAQTAAGETWISTSGGLVGMATAALDRAFSKPGAPIRTMRLDFRDGLTGAQSRDTNRAAVRGGDGRLWFANGTGTVWIDPAHLPSNPAPPPVVISALKAGRAIFHDPGDLKLTAGTSNLEIDFAAPSLSIPERVKVLYRLEGSDEAWIDPGARRQAFYTNLAPGRYAFKVIAANDDGVWNRAGATLRIEIPPTFLQSYWFKGLILLAVVGLLWLAYLLRVRSLKARMRAKLEERLAERERIARDLHDTLLQGFQGLILRFQSVANEIPPQLKARGLIEQALESADSVLSEGRDSVHHLRAMDSTDLAEALADTAERLRRDRPLEFRMTVEGAPRRLHPVVREELSRIGDEALSNAFRHSSGRTVELVVSYRSAALVVSVRDDGAGIDPAVLERGGRQGHFGLVGMRERAEQIHSELHVSSRAGGGTEVQVAVAGRVAYAGDRRAAFQARFLTPPPQPA